MMDQVLSQATALGVPVLIDMAYFGLCSGLTFDLSWPCITDVTFSLSKSFPVANARIGMRLTRIDDDDPLFVVNKTRYINRLGAALGLTLIKKFPADYIPTKYRDLQQQWCQQLEADPSPTVIFGMGHKKWTQYDRGAGNHRLCFNRYMGSGQLPSPYQ
jgi:histidinol-phosphate/aromatic aminotransferase/cobyric acid decarboxylase-like protein